MFFFSSIHVARAFDQGNIPVVRRSVFSQESPWYIFAQKNTMDRVKGASYRTGPLGCVLREDCKDSHTIHLIEGSLYLALKVQPRVVHRQAG